MNTTVIPDHRQPPWWRTGIFPLVWLTFLTGVGFLVQLPETINLHAIAAELHERDRIVAARHATTILMALGASALLAGTMLRDHVRSAQPAPQPRKRSGAAPRAVARPAL